MPRALEKALWTGDDAQALFAAAGDGSLSPLLPPWIAPRTGGCLLRVRVAPGARRDALAEGEDGILKVRVAAPPVGGAANERLVKFLARKVLGLPRSAVWITSGARGRRKSVAVDAPAGEVVAAVRGWGS